MNDQTETVFCVCMFLKDCLHALFNINKIDWLKLFNQAYFFLWQWCAELLLQAFSGTAGWRLHVGLQQSLCCCSCACRALAWSWDACLQEEFVGRQSFATVLDNVNESTKSIFLLHVHRRGCSRNYLVRVFVFLRLSRADTTFSVALLRLVLCWTRLRFGGSGAIDHFLEHA